MRAGFNARNSSRSRRLFKRINSAKRTTSKQHRRNRTFKQEGGMAGRTNERTNERTDERTNERTNERTKERKKETHARAHHVTQRVLSPRTQSRSAVATMCRSHKNPPSKLHTTSACTGVGRVGTPPRTIRARAMRRPVCPVLSKARLSSASLVRSIDLVTWRQGAVVRCGGAVVRACVRA